MARGRVSAGRNNPDWWDGMTTNQKLGAVGAGAFFFGIAAVMVAKAVGGGADVDEAGAIVKVQAFMGGGDWKGQPYGAYHSWTAIPLGTGAWKVTGKNLILGPAEFSVSSAGVTILRGVQGLPFQL